MLGSVANHQAGLCAKMPKKMAEDVVKKLQVPPLLSCAAVLLCSAALSLWLCRARVHAGVLDTIETETRRVLFGRPLQALDQKMRAGQVAKEVTAQMIQWCQALEQNNAAGAAAIQTQLTATVWDEHGPWLQATKRLVDQAKKG